MAVTPGGLPYPVATDPVALGAANIQALAEAVDPRIGLQVTPATMPASPFDGQRIRLLVDAAKGVEWLFVYRAASSNAEKWEFLGGPPLTGWEFVLVNVTPVGGWSNLGPIVVAPRPGVYNIMTLTQGSNVSAGNTTLLAGPAVTAPSGSANPALPMQASAAAGQGLTVVSNVDLTVTAGQWMQSGLNPGAAVQSQTRQIVVVPVRIS